MSPAHASSTRDFIRSTRELDRRTGERGPLDLTFILRLSETLSRTSNRTSNLTSDLSKRERQEKIRELVVGNGFVRIEQLVADFDVSLMTIHRDLDDLESQGWLRKVRGGATAQPSAVHHGDITHRLASNMEAKAEIAQAAASLVQPGQAVVLDDSTTALHVARQLPERGPLTVITNSMLVMRELAGKSQLDLVALGGVYYTAYDAFFGMQTMEAARSLSADLLFMSTTAITDGRCYHQSQETVQVKRVLMDISATRILVTDHSKFARRALHELAPVTEFDTMIVDRATPSEIVESLVELGTEVRVADPT